jgi:hypothetical protein
MSLGIDAFGKCKECFREVNSTGFCPDCHASRIYVAPTYGQLLDGTWGVVDPGYDGPSKHYWEYLERRSA